VLYHSGTTFGKVLYSSLDVLVVDVSDYSGHLVRHFLNASEAFPTEWFLQFWEQVKVWRTEPIVSFLFKDEFILQNTFTDLQCNLHCALSQRSNVWESLVFLSGRLRC
jgi:hypothetical protein